VLNEFLALAMVDGLRHTDERGAGLVSSRPSISGEGLEMSGRSAFAIGSGRPRPARAKPKSALPGEADLAVCGSVASKG